MHVAFDLPGIEPKLCQEIQCVCRFSSTMMVQNPSIGFDQQVGERQ